MINKILIVGYGRAGKRHARILRDEFDLPIAIVDPAINSEYEHYLSLEYALTRQDYSAVVIATPPDQHIEQVNMALDADLPVLCEKPLCDLGQLKDARLIDGKNLMIAYNYRWHPDLVARSQLTMPSTPPRYYKLSGQQYRDSMPSWGLFLDHMPHNYDTMNWMTGSITRITRAVHGNSAKAETWDIEGDATRGIFKISECLLKKPAPREVVWIDPRGAISISSNPVMFSNMWKAFLHGDYSPGLKEAIGVQELLEETIGIAKEV